MVNRLLPEAKAKGLVPVLPSITPASSYSYDVGSPPMGFSEAMTKE
jgi:hypothetical protein